MIVVLMGVAGSGKTRVGTRLAEALDCAFLDADSLHSPADVEKMSRGVPLTDEDRAPWLASIHARLLDAYRRGQRLVVGCSALRQSYRAVLSDRVRITWVYLKGSEDLIQSRLRRRTSHFMQAEMLASQVETLEEPSDAIVVDIAQPVDTIVEQIVAELRLTPDVRIVTDADELSRRSAEAAVERISSAVRARGRCSLVLSGGSTPRALYRELASRFRDRTSWENVHVFWGDERYVGPDHEQSNYRMARETLLDHVPIPSGNVHPMSTRFADTDDAARDYEATLRSYFAGASPSFDLVLLGIGADGHTASLFPGSAALEEASRWVVPVNAPAEPPSRLTLTYPLLTAAANCFFLATGSDKAHPVGRVITGTADPNLYPAAGIRPDEGTVVWWVDRDAAAELH